ncbi:transposase [Parafrankia sp. FMc6]|uniref:RNA-guided endonuclease InsQ/TnpB family protein n=1 Tax=Parafrankia soli TaxID=2599596 RepID=UPI0034D749EA
MRRAFRFQLRPTVRQTATLTTMLDDHRILYNAGLQERREAWRHPSRTTVRYGDQSAQLTEIRAVDPEQGRWSFSSQQATLRRLDRAMAAFFRRVKAGGKPGYPRFKGRNWFDTVVWPRDGDGCRWDSQPHHPTQTRVRLQAVGHVKVHQHRPVRGTIKTISVKREGRRWYVLLSCDHVPAEPLPATGTAVGVDLGVASLATFSDGRQVDNPRYLAAAADRLAHAQQMLSRKKRGSARRRKAVAKVAGLHRRVRRQRLDLAHRTALGLIREYDLIAVEALRVGNMTRRAAPRPDPDRPGVFLPNGQGAKSGLNRSVLDAGWGVFLDVLRAKAESAGRVVVEVEPAHTSRTCAACGHCAAENRRTQAVFACTACGHAAHADVNAAANILRAGLARQATHSA